MKVQLSRLQCWPQLTRAKSTTIAVVLAALLSTSSGAAVPTVEAEPTQVICDWNEFINFFNGFSRPETEQYCSIATKCDGKNETPLPRNNVLGSLDILITAFLNPPILDKDNEMKMAFFGCQRSCRCPNVNSAE
jgi:hypothetical protein